MKKEWPPFDAGFEVINTFIFEKPLQWLDDKIGRAKSLPRFDDHQWDRYNPETDFARLTKKLGFPADLVQHEQPRQMGKLWPLAIHSDASNCEAEIFLNRALFVLWLVRVDELADTLPPKEALRKIQLMSEKLTYYYGSNNRVWRECQSEQVKEWAKWLRCTHGGYDLASGTLTDDGREFAAMRDNEMDGGAS
jgi:hypothetical protein